VATRKATRVAAEPKDEPQAPEPEAEPEVDEPAPSDEESATVAFARLNGTVQSGAL
jgi:hypothetical protein